MLYFIPAWYRGQDWCENEQPWYQKRTKSEFDETVKQITLFHRNVKLDYKILLLSYFPNLRHFLHRQGMFRAPYWSCFDAMAQIRRKKVSTLSFRDLEWPSDVEFVYSSFAILAFRGEEKYAKIEFAEDGNLLFVDLYENGRLSKRNRYDDRGFLSLCIHYYNEEELYRDYLMENGIWKMRVDAKDGHVKINPHYPCFDVIKNGDFLQRRFQKENYPSLASVIEEVLSAQMKETQKADQFFVAMHPLHGNLLSRCLKEKKVILTFFEERCSDTQILQMKDFLRQAEYVVTDSEETTVRIKNQLGEEKINIMDISPYDARMDFGISAHLKIQNILLPIDGLPEEAYRIVIGELFTYLQKNEYARVHLFTRDASAEQETRIRRTLQELLLELGGYHTSAQENENGQATQSKRKDQNRQTGQAGQNRQAGEGELNMSNLQKQQDEARFFIDVCVDERTISKCMHEQRVILDLRQKTDVYLAITAISKGVPRICMKKDPYVVHQKNGYLIEEYAQIKEALSFYLDDFENWNNALIECYKMVQKYATNELLDSWRKVLKIRG